ncbi:MAG: glycosyltransferase family 4 protein [Rikenellaceae bacterium]
MPNVTFINVPFYPTKSSNRLAWLIEYNRNYTKWHKDAYEAAKKICLEEPIDVIHYLNPIGFKEPGYLYKIKNIPYVWGPILGVHERKWSMRQCLSKFMKFEDYVLRNMIHKCSLKFGCRVHHALKRANIVLAATKHSQTQFERYHNIKAIYLPENGIPKMERVLPISRSIDEPLRLIWIGHIVHRKALIILLKALNKQVNHNWQLDVLGNGKLKGEMQRFCDINNMSDRVTFHGSIPRENVFELISSAHLHVISSLGEANTTVIWEAMANGVPTMTLDHCGMADVVCDKCGIKIPINSYDQVVDDMANHIARLIENPSEIERMSKGVLECSKDFMYENRIALFDEIYESITKQ